MLTNLLPGLRHLRAPFAAGCLYLLTLWALLGSQLLPDPSTEGPVANLSQLADLLGRSGTMAAVSFAAYLLGSLAVFRRWPRGITVQLKRIPEDSNPSPSTWAVNLNDWLYATAREFAGRITFRDLIMDPRVPDHFAQNAISWSIQGPVDFPTLEKIREQYEPSAGVMTSGLYHQLVGSLDQTLDHEALWQGLLADADDEIVRAAAQLRIERPSLYDEYDRFRSEAELRYAIATPLILLAVALAIGSSIFWLFALLVPALLVLQGYRSERDSLKVVIDSMRYGTITSPIVRTLRSIVESRSVAPEASSDPDAPSTLETIGE